MQPRYLLELTLAAFFAESPFTVMASLEERADLTTYIPFFTRLPLSPKVKRCPTLPV